MSIHLSRNQSNELLYIGYNQDYQCFAVGTDTGFRIYNTDPFKETFQRDFTTGGIAYIEMLFRCNILALVGGGRNPRYPPNKVMIWDDHQNRCIGELSFRSEVRGVKLRRDRVVVVLEHKIYIYNFADLKLIDHIETYQNSRGLIALSSSSTNTVLVCPGLQKGHLRIELYDQKKTTLIDAHESALACITLNTDGTRVATASDTGTLIRIFDTATGQALQELRRGADRAEIYSICFNPTNEWLATSSDKGTIHIFALEGSVSGKLNHRTNNQHINNNDNKQLSSSSNPTSSLSFMKKMLPKYFSSQWSYAQYRVPDSHTIVSFGNDKNSIIVLSADGSYYKAFFDDTKPNTETVQESYARFVHE